MGSSSIETNGGAYLPFGFIESDPIDRAAVKFDALLRAHSFMKVERPPEIWEGETEDVRFLPLLGEMIASGLVRSAQLADLTLSVSNVLVEHSPGDDEAGDPDPGEYVAVTVRGAGDWGAEGIWPSTTTARSSWLAGMEDRLRTAGVPYAYVREFQNESSVTIFLRRLQ